MTNPSDRVGPAQAGDLQRRGAVIRELDRRRSDDITVTLLWNAGTNRVFVSVLEKGDDMTFEFEVAGADAADAFHHPYAYADTR